MAEKMYYWGEDRDQVDADQAFIEFKAKSVGSEKRRESSRAVPKMTVSSPQGKVTEVGNREEDTERGGWDNKLDFLFSCISVSVGLGNTTSSWDHLRYRKHRWDTMGAVGLSDCRLAARLLYHPAWLGACDGLLYYVTPRWKELLSPGPWIDGATQIFFAYSIGTGALPALGSYNKFHHNCYKDALITCIVNTLTCLLAGCVTFSILGHIASEQGTEVSEVVKSGPGLVFLTYPEVVLKLPGASMWAIIFFVMLLILGIDSEFCIVESFITGMVDNWPDLLRPHRNKFTIAICVMMFALGIPMVTNGGVYIFQLMDFYSASGMSILWVCFFQTIAISWIFGAQKFCDCIHQMMGIRMNKFWYICWVVFAPVIMVFIFVFQCVQYKPLKYGSDYEYPTWAEIVGMCLSLSSMIWIPVYALYYVLVTPGSIKENILKGLKPNIKLHPKLPKGEKSAVIPMSESSAGLITKNNSFLSQT
ncbi:Sodium- and chloride-dependent GABA transporter 1 [Dufourea novaeangliae]|uniref:Sodium-and chloride-dependent GABA transporter 1 n=1 Tax=Dufourea novaeangliae TaxID=178035 RepID=A0A154PES1_DUFNO|nr:Sodium- and chloride-dependent GABA transporter 1 [Dufourea novaeangliae]